MKRMVSTKGGDQMFVFEKYDEDKINKMILCGRSMWDAKASNMISYLAELAYDIMILPSNNVLENLGFENCHGVW